MPPVKRTDSQNSLNGDIPTNQVCTLIIILKIFASSSCCCAQNSLAINVRYKSCSIMPPYCMYIS